MGEGWRLGVVQTPPAWSGGGVLGASEGVRRVLLEPKIVPARTRELDRARAAKKAAKNAAAAADAGSSEPPPWRSAGGDGGASGLRLGRGGGRTSLRGSESTLFAEAAPGTCRGVRGESGGL